MHWGIAFFILYDLQQNFLTDLFNTFFIKIWIKRYGEFDIAILINKYLFINGPERKFSLMKKLSEIFYIYKVDIVNVALQFFYTIFYSTAHNTFEDNRVLRIRPVVWHSIWSVELAKCEFCLKILWEYLCGATLCYRVKEKTKNLIPFVALNITWNFHQPEWLPFCSRWHDQ